MSKTKYHVYLVGHGHGCYAEDYYREDLGSTWAVSPEKAISNIRYRLRQAGEILPCHLGDREGLGYVNYELEAVAV